MLIRKFKIKEFNGLNVIINKEIKRILVLKKEFLDAVLSLQRQFFRLCCYFFPQIIQNLGVSFSTPKSG